MSSEKSWQLRVGHILDEISSSTITSRSKWTSSGARCKLTCLR